MATTVARLEAVLRADTGHFDRAMTQSESKMHRVGRTAGIAGAAIAGGLVFGLEKSVKAAMDAQVSEARLDQAFKTSGMSAARYHTQVLALEKANRRLGFTDEQTKDALGSLLIATHSMSKASKDLSVAQDISRFKHVDLTAATKMLTMAMAGSQRATKQLGLSVQASTDNADKAKEAYKKQKDALDAQFPSMAKMTAAQKEQFYALRDNLEQQYAAAKAEAILQDKSVTSAKVIDLVSKKLHGQADEYSKTAAGGMEQFRAQLDHLEVSLGTVLLPVLAKVAGALATATEFFSKHESATKLLVAATALLSAALIAASLAGKLLASTLFSKVIPALARTTAAQTLLNIAVRANPYILAATAIAVMSVALVVLWQRSKTARTILEIVAGLLTMGMAPAIIETVRHWNEMTGAVGRASNRLAALPAAAAAKALAVIHGAIQALNAGVHALVRALEKVVDLFKWIIGAAGKIVGVIGKIGGVIGGAAGAIGDASGRALGQARRGPGGPSGPAPRGSGAKEGMAFHVGRQLWDEIGMGEQLGLRVTSGYRPGAVTKHRTKSDHSYFPSRAVDMSGSAGAMAGLFRNLVGRREIRQAFYDPLGSIFNGVWNSYREGGHSDHVHVAEYDRGGWLRPGWNLAYNGLGRPERVGNGGGDVHIHLSNHGILGRREDVVDWLRSAGAQFQRRNGRPAFEGG